MVTVKAAVHAVIVWKTGMIVKQTNEEQHEW